MKKKRDIDWEQFHSVIHKMNLEATKEERIHWNRFKLELWNIADKLVDYGNMPSASYIAGGDLPQLCRDLKELINMIPTIEK